MIELYYTPEVIAYFIYKFDFNEQNKIELIHNIYDYEKAFIHPKYQNNKKLFLKRILEFTDYLYYKDDLDNESKSIKKHMKELGHNFTNQYILLKKPPLNFFFVTTRLQLLFNDKSYVRIKLRTLLKSYGYKKKSEKILKHLEKCMYFYHIQAFRADKEIDIFKTDIDDMITFRKTNHYNISNKTDAININIKEVLEEIESKFQNKHYKVSKINGNKSRTYILNDSLKITCILYPNYIKSKIHVKPQILEKITSKMEYRIENNQIIYYLHDNYDLNQLFETLETSHNLISGLNKQTKEYSGENNMKVQDLVNKFNKNITLDSKILNHKIGIIMPPIDEFTYSTKTHDGVTVHVFTSEEEYDINTIILNEKENTVSVLKEPKDGGMAPYYKEGIEGTIEMS